MHDPCRTQRHRHIRSGRVLCLWSGEVYTQTDALVTTSLPPSFTHPIADILLRQQTANTSTRLQVRPSEPTHTDLKQYSGGNQARALFFESFVFRAHQVLWVKQEKMKKIWGNMDRTTKTSANAN